MRRGVALNTNGPYAKGLAELNHHMRDEHKELRDGGGGGGQGLSEEEESKLNNESSENTRHLPPIEAALETQVVLQRQQQPPQGPVVQWERFLPLRSLKVLLVENDDSTRHVVSALLRNCSYEVVAVANGSEGWKVVKDQTNRIDLVLTEVVMPILTGVALLSLIKSHKTCKNIPVIMMSSNDSMGIVFKCLSKGAVDFLVKPIRKNELKNLWQHVWRKCHSSSGSASESGIRPQKSTKSKSVEGSENNSGSNEEEYGSIGLNAKNGSDNGSGTQTSWSKRIVEVDSPQPTSPCAEPPDSTCAQVVHSRPEAFSNNWVPRTECHNDDNELDSCYVMGKDLEIGVPRNSDMQLEDPTKNNDKLYYLNLKKDCKRVDGDEGANTENKKTVVDLLSSATNNNYYNTKTTLKCVANEVTNEVPNTTRDQVVVFDDKELPSLELSLKRQRDVGSTGQERNVLRHSDLSAFSRYNTSSTNNTRTGIVGSCSPLDNSSEAAKTESLLNLQSNGTPNQRSNGSSNDDMGSTTNNVVTKPEAFTDKPTPKSTVSIHPCSAFQPVQQANGSTLQPEKGDAETSNVQVQHQHHHHQNHHQHIHNMLQQQQQQQQVNSHEDSSLRKKLESASHCGTSNVMNGSIEGNAANYSLNGSTSGSNKRSSGENSGGGTISEGMQMGSDNGGGAAKCGVDDGSGSGSGSRSGVDQNRLAQREAALKKFRQKRKDRCFEKKVRYQSRKKLAEQKPRVRGQFVRKTIDENKKKDSDS